MHQRLQRLRVVLAGLHDHLASVSFVAKGREKLIQISALLMVTNFYKV